MKTGWFEAKILYEISSWGIGFQVGKTKYSHWRFFASLDFLCFFLFFWFGVKND